MGLSAGRADTARRPVFRKSKYSIGACDAINTYFGRGQIPLGAYHGNAVGKDEGMTAGYNEIAKNTAHFKHRVVARDRVPSAVSVYRKTLASQPDQSVSIVVVGFLTNVSALLESGPDENSSANGSDLVASKVKELSVMGGRYPSGREYNFSQRGAAPYAKRGLPSSVSCCTAGQAGHRPEVGHGTGYSIPCHPGLCSSPAAALLTRCGPVATIIGGGVVRL